MTYRAKIILSSLVFPVLMLVFAVLGGFFTGSLEQYIGIVAGVFLALHLCWYLSERWDADKLQPTESTSYSFFVRDEVLLGNAAALFVLIAILSSLFQRDVSVIYGPFAACLVIIGSGYIIARLIIQK